jgi:hypothetical protein
MGLLSIDVCVYEQSLPYHLYCYAENVGDNNVILELWLGTCSQSPTVAIINLAPRR